MFDSGILDVAIGLIFIYLLLSLICSAINEMIEARLKIRATTLERAVRELLNDPTGTGLVKKLYEHPLVYGLFQGSYDPKKITHGNYQSGSNLPSYIPARNFALALMDIVLPAQSAAPGTRSARSGAAGATASPSAPVASTTPGGAPPLQALRDAIGSIQNPKVEQALRILLDASGNDVSKARENIELWFDSTMDRAAGWYKRRVQGSSFILGLVISIVVNADTITIGNSLSNDVAMRDSLVAAAQEYAKPSNLSTLSPSQNPNSEIEACRKDENSPACKVAENLNQIRKLGLPIGWDRNDPRTIPDFPSWAWFIKLLGWLITATAISLGAPFWFDVLNKFMVVRATVKPREKSPEEPPVG